MEINRSNYEIWLIDLVEGNLSKDQAVQVTLFLEQNPDLRDEFNSLKSPIPEINRNVFKNKEEIKKTPNELPVSQFEILCASFYEGDLHGQQEEEFMEIIESNHDRRKISELFGRTRLIAPVVEFKNKQLLKRITPLQKVIRLSLIGLSSAASIALLITISWITLRNINVNQPDSAQDFTVFPDLKEKYFEIPSGIVIRKNYPAKIFITKSTGPDHSYSAVLTEPDTINTVRGRAITEGFSVSPIPASMIILTAYAGIQQEGSSLLLTTPPVGIILPEAADMSNVERFVARIFREKILREKVTKETPLKGYEIAEAGVAGLNILLGWEMALNEKNDENGDLKSVYFSSKILKFNAPVKKTEEGE